MEIFIGLLLLGVVVLVVLFFKFTKDEDKQQKNMEDAKGRRIADLEAEGARKDVELKKLMEERQHLEDEFFKAKDQVDIFKKENSELMLKLKAQEKSKEEGADARADLKQKEMMLSQETVARQKLQGEISLRELEIDKLTKECKAKTEMLEGLKGQYSELETELIKAREEALKKQPSSEPKIEPKKEPDPGVKTVSEVKAEVKVEAKPEVKVDMKPEAGPEVKSEARPEVKSEARPEVKSEARPAASVKVEPKIEPKVDPAPKPGTSSSGIPSDIDFLKTETPQKKDEGSGVAGIPEGAFKLTNVNKPAAPPEKDKDKNKSKKEVLIDGFHPKPPHSEPHA
jgi:hypothetical protein